MPVVSGHHRNGVSVPLYTSLKKNRPWIDPSQRTTSTPAGPVMMLFTANQSPFDMMAEPCGARFPTMVLLATTAPCAPSGTLMLRAPP